MKWLDNYRAEPHSRKSVLTALLMGMAFALILTLGVSATKAFAICQGAPDYTGCTTKQIRVAEARTAKVANHHYRRAEWGQAHRIEQLSNKADRKMRREYRHAVNRYVANKTTQLEAKGAEVTAATVQPKYRTWRGFKRNTACNMGFWGGALSAWCTIQNAENEALEKVTSTALHLTLSCGGEALIVGGLGNPLVDKLLKVAVTAAKMRAWATGGAVVCLANRFKSSINPFD